MKNLKQKKPTAQLILTIVLFLIIAAQIIRVTLYSYTTFYQNLQSDMASDLLQAELAASQGHLFFADEWFVSTELRVIGINIIPTILFYFGLSYRMIWALTCGIGAILIAGSVYFAMRMLRLERFESLLASLLILLPTGELSYWLYVYPIYQMFLILLILLTALLTRLIAPDTHSWRICALGMLVSFLSGLCGTRLLIQGMIPVLIFMLYRVLRKLSNKDINLSLVKDTVDMTWPVLLCAASMVAGYVIYEFVLGNKYGNGYASFEIDSINEISKTLLRLPEAFLLLFGLSYQPTSIVGGYAFLIQVAFISLSFACAGWLLAYRNRLDHLKSSAVKISTVLIVFSYILVCTMNNDEAEGPFWRYFALGAYPILLVIPLAISNWSKRSLRYVLAVVISLLVFTYPSYQSAKEINAGIREPYQPPAYLSYLEENHYTFGEATFWNANNNTILSNGEIRIKSVCNDETLSFYDWLTHKEYCDREGEFLLLTQEEYQLRQQSGWETPYRIVYSDDMYLVFDKRISNTPR